MKLEDRILSGMVLTLPPKIGQIARHQELEDGTLAGMVLTLPPKKSRLMPRHQCHFS
jgi:hypothetical protein